MSEDTKRFLLATLISAFELAFWFFAAYGAWEIVIAPVI